MAADIPDQVFSIEKRRHRPRVQYAARGCVYDFHFFVSTVIVPVEEIESDLVRLAISQVDVHVKEIVVDPTGGDSVSRGVGLLQGSRVCR